MRRANGRSFVTLMVTMIAMWGASTASAAEPYQAFVDGLRERQLFDEAMAYLEQVESDPKTPDDFRQRIDFEKAETLIRGASLSRNAEAQTRQLDRAAEVLDKATKARPDHPLAGRAFTSHGQILINRARVKVIEARLPANAERREELQKEARDFVTAARAAFKKAYEQHRAAWEKCPPFIDQEKDAELFVQRRVAEMNHIKSQLDLALCTYEEAQTWAPGSREYKTVLTKASTEFEFMHQKYRSQAGGLFARMWQGKCFEEQEDLGKALGIYNELLEHPGGSATMDRLQSQVLQFRLVCLNHDQRKDYELTVNEASKWLARNRSLQRTLVGLGIRWERARALERLAARREITDADRLNYLEKALVDAHEVLKYPGQYKDASQIMVARLNAELGRIPGEPTDIGFAFGAGGKLVKENHVRGSALAAARREGKPVDEIAKLAAELDQHWNEAARLLRLGLALANDQTEIDQVNNCRHLLAYVLYRQQRNYESAILSEFIASRYPHADPQLALDSAYMAMAAWQQAYNAVPKDQSRDVEIAQMIRVCNLISKNWPVSAQANDARMNLGQLYSQQHKPEEAALWYGQVPESSSEYAEAQLAAGQAYWTAFLLSRTRSESDRPPAAELAKWQSSAEKHLAVGIQQSLKGIVPDQPAPDSLIAAKASLAQIRVNQGANRDAIALLVDPPHAVLDAIPLRQPGLVEIEIPPRRPPTGIRSRDFHIQTYASLLRASVGAGQTDRALDAMNRLEALGGGAGVDDIYRQLGDELQKELVRLRNDPHRQVEVRNSFEKFLAALSRRKDSLSYGGVMWLGEAWQGLGRAIDVDRPPAEDAPRLFRAASAAFETVVARAELGEGDDDREFVSSGRLMMVRLRLADCRRRLGDYEAALHAIAPVLKESPDSLETQRAAAQILQDWGASGRAETRGRLLDAVDGPRTGSLRGVVWGWKTLAFRLQRQADAGLTAAAFHTQFLEVRYNAFWCRAQYGKSAVDYAAFQDELIPLSHEIAEFARGEGEIPDDHWKRLDALYRDIQKAVVPGKEPTPLPRRGAAK